MINRTFLLAGVTALSVAVHAQWTPVAPYGGHFFSNLSLHDTLLVGTPCGIYRSVDDGVHFTPHSQGMPAGDVIGLFDNDGRLFACIRDKGIYLSDDRGVTWRLSLAGRYLGQSDLSPQRFEKVGGSVFVHGYIADSLYFTANNGVSWTQRYLGTGTYSHVNSVGNALLCYSGAGQLGATQGLYRSTDMGQTWTPTNQTANVRFCRAVGGTVYGFGTEVYVSNDQGTTFTQATSFGAVYSPSMVTHDGTRFWITTSLGSTVEVKTWQYGQSQALDALGNLPAAGSQGLLFAHSGRVWLSRLDYTHSATVPGSWTQNSLSGVNGVVLYDMLLDGQGAMAGMEYGWYTAAEADAQWTAHTNNDLYNGIWNVARDGSDLLVGMGYLSSGTTSLRRSADVGGTWSYPNPAIADIRVGYCHFEQFPDTVMAYGPSATYDTPRLLMYGIQGNVLADHSLGLYGVTLDDRVTSAVHSPNGIYAVVAGEFDTNAYIFHRPLGVSGFWSLLTSTLNGQLIKATAIAERNGRVFLGLAGNAGVLISDDNGTTWNPYNDGLNQVTPSSFTVAEGMVFMASNKGVYLLRATGDSWEALPNTLPIGEVQEVLLGSTYVWVRLRNGGAWKLPRAGFVGVNERTATAEALRLWPSAVTDAFTVALPWKEASQLEVFDAQGRSVLRRNVPLGAERCTVNVPALVSGSYTCVVHSDAHRASRPFVKLAP